jgi:hypothetical protein
MGSSAGRKLRRGFDVIKDVKKHIFAQAAMLMFFGLAQVMPGQSVPPSAATGLHKVQVNDRALGQKMASGGARLIADYGGYELYDAPASMTNLPPDKAELRDDDNLILLNASRLDATAAEVKALRTNAGNFAGQRLHLVHFAGPVQPDWRQALLDAGARIVSYIPQNTYLIYGDAPAIARVQAQAAAAPRVQWEGAYLDDYKIHPSAKPGVVKGDQFAIQLVFDAAANAETLKLIDQLKLAPLARQRHVLDFVNVVARIAPANLARIAARPDVISIQPYATPRKLCERQDQIVAGNLSGSVPSGPGYLAWLGSKGFSQSQFTNFSVDVSDSGIDDGTTHPNHFGLYAGGIISSANSRVIYNRLEGTANPGSTLAGCDGHGNLNAHIVGGYDNNSGAGVFEDSSGYHFGLGVCPFVSLGSSVIFDPTNFTSPIYEDLMSQAYEDGARISNNSWGDSGGGEDSLYTLDSQEYDALVRDAQPAGSPYPAAGNQEMVIVFAAGNDGPDAKSVSPPATGKNIISVGAAENVQAFGGNNDGADLGGTTDAQADDANAVAYFSGEGPCSDGRQKPDLVAPGTHVSGGAPQAANPGPDGTALACYLDNTTNTIGVDGGSDNSFFFPDTGQQFYTASTGTSHATPCVSGGCALLRQYFINQGWTPPSPAMTKAWLMNAARYLTGAYADDTLWSPSQGMGEMNLGTAFDGTSRFLRDEVAGDMFTASGQTRVFSGVVANATEPFRVTVAWTDAPGSTTGAAYNNDLDLTVTVGGATYKGNVFSGANSTTGGSADRYNNVESVFLPAGVSGDYTVTVTANSINSVGVPGGAGAVNQDFALVVYNSGSAPVPVAAGALVTPEPCAANSAIYPGETVTVGLIIQNAGSVGTTNLVATLLAGNGVASPSGLQTYGALAPGAAATNTYSFVAEGTCGAVITATLQLQDGAAGRGTVSYNFQLGQLVTTTNFAENFDEVTPPNLPAGWSTSDTENKGVIWTTESGASYSSPNAVYCPDAAFIDEVYLTSPGITLPSGPCQLSFQQSFNLEDTYDGGILQIKIGSGSFEDILAAGGTFATGGYVEELTEPDDPRHCLGPLLDDDAWSGTSDGFMTTVVNLPSSAEGQTIQLRWACGTDCENEALVGTGGWWIDNIAIIQTNWSCATNVATAVPVILSPTNGYVSSATDVITLTGTTMASASLTLYDNGVSNETITACPTGAFSRQVTLAGGTNVLVVTEGAANASAPVTVYALPAAPTLQVAPISDTNVEVSGSGQAGAQVNILTNGALAALFTDNASGHYAGSVTLPYGSYLMSATETVGGLTSFPSAATTVSVVSVAAPAILSPLSGLLTTNDSLTVTGTGVPVATVSVYDGSNVVGTATVDSSGNFSLAVYLSNGTNVLTATQNSGGVVSPPSAAVTVTLALQPLITAQPQSLTGFLKEKVTFSTGVYGAKPMHLWWEKNGVKISGATTSNLTLSSLAAASAATYKMIASNSYGATASDPAVLTLAGNPFTDLTGTYYGLFSTRTNAQFDSSGFLKLTLGSLGAFSGSILNAGGSYSFSGSFSITGHAEAPVSRGAKLTPLIVNMNLDVSNGTEQIMSSNSYVSNASWIAPLQADRATFGPANHFPYPGKFTMSFGNTNNGSVSPGGDGYGTVSISTAGMATWSGVLADDTSVVPAAVSISKNGQWPLYLPLYGKLGSLSGWLVMTNAGGFTGEANWFRVGPYGKLYPDGFTNALSIDGYAFTPGTSKIPVLETANVVLTLSGGGLGTNLLTNALTLYNTGKFETNGGEVSKLTLSVAPSTGVISGSFLDPETLRTTTIRGVVLQPTNAAGFFLSTNATGLFFLAP